MLSPADLLELAEAFADRIPHDRAYEDERAVSWTLIAEASLALGDPEAAQRALKMLPSGGFEGQVRCGFARWALAHPQSEVGRAVLRETVAEIDRLEPWFTRSDLIELAPITAALLGTVSARRIAEQVSELPKELSAMMEKAMAQANVALARAQEILGREEPVAQPPSSPADLLSRYLSYKYNDLKVRWLTDQAAAGGLDNPELETRVSSEDFLRVEPARQPNIHCNPDNLSPAEFKDFFFARAVPLAKADEDLLRGEYLLRGDHYPDESLMVSLATDLLLDFKAVGQRYSQKQIDQGLGFLFSYPCWFYEYLDKEEVPLNLRLACVEAMIVPFRDYLEKSDNNGETAFYMWWDRVRISGPEMVPVARRVLEEILQLSRWPCGKAALHGLNHLWPKEDTFAIVSEFLMKHGSELDPEQLEYAELCRDCEAQ